MGEGRADKTGNGVQSILPRGRLPLLLLENTLEMLVRLIPGGRWGRSSLGPRSQKTQETAVTVRGRERAGCESLQQLAEVLRT